MSTRRAPELFPALRYPAATFSPCGRYRYTLSWPTGLAQGSRDRVLFILANPSTATADDTDPTVNRCIGFARTWGYTWCDVVNVRAWRETDPKKVPPDPEAIGPDNDTAILDRAWAADVIVCGWGKLGGARGLDVLKLLRFRSLKPHALKLNGDGSPAHPLYLRGNLLPLPMGST